MKTIKKFGVFQTAKVAAVIYFFLALIIIIPMFLIMSMLPAYEETNVFPGNVFLFVMPFLYGIMGFVFTAIGCVIYNFIAARMGGITIEVETTENPVV